MSLTAFKRLDWVLIAAIFALAVVSLVALWSVSENLFWRQFVWFIIAFFIIIVGSQLDWRFIGGQTWFRQGIYWLSILLLLISNLQSTTIRGTKRWLVLGNFQFEPSELAKAAVIIILAGFFSKRYVSAWQSRNIIVSFFYVLLPMILVLIHPDFSSAVIIMGLWGSFLIVGGINKKRFALGIVVGIVVLTVFWTAVLAPYQKNRLIGFMFPEYDPLGVNYNVIQSKIAIGSAGFWGKGFMGGTQVQLNFLPEAHSDFLFAAFVEEWGILGGAVLILTFLTLLYRLTLIGRRAGDNYSKFLVLGTGLLFAFHFFINVGSNLGLLPVTGLTFPFVSYGGSNLLTAAFLVGIIERIKIDSR